MLLLWPGQAEPCQHSMSEHGRMRTYRRSAVDMRCARAKAAGWMQSTAYCLGQRALGGLCMRCTVRWLALTCPAGRGAVKASVVVHDTFHTTRC